MQPNGIEKLLAIMKRLRAPDGCPWDREQTHRTLRPYLLEEAYEVADAIDRGEPRRLCEELGDLLLQVVFHAQLADEVGTFNFDQVATGIAEKLVRRHPHVFADQPAATAVEAWNRWDAIKVQERKAQGEPAPSSLLDQVAAAQPALARATALAAKAARSGFDWPDHDAVLDKVDEETSELRHAVRSGQPAQTEAELGDLLFAVASLAARLKLDPEASLARANTKFVRRFQAIEQELQREGLEFSQLTAEQLDLRWQRTKQDEP
jgi:MazG family protein